LEQEPNGMDGARDRIIDMANGGTFTMQRHGWESSQPSDWGWLKALNYISYFCCFWLNQLN